MAFETKVVRHGPVPVGEMPVSGFISGSPRQQRTQSQQREFVEHETRVSLDVSQSLHRCLRFREVAFGAASDERFHLYAHGRPAASHLTQVEVKVNVGPGQFDRAVEIAERGLLSRELGVDESHYQPRWGQNTIADQRKHLP